MLPLDELMVALEEIFPTEQVDPVDSKTVFIWEKDEPNTLNMICNIVKKQYVEVHFRSTMKVKVVAEIVALLSKLELNFEIGSSFVRLPDQSLVQGDAAARYAQAIVNPEGMTPVFLPSELFIEKDSMGILTNRGVRYSN